MMLCGGRTEYYEDLPKKILSAEITRFKYSATGQFIVSAVMCEDDDIEIVFKRCDQESREWARSEYKAHGSSFMKKLQEIIEKYDLAEDNGHYVNIAGLPPRYGGELSVLYKSGERIFRHNNQSEIISEAASNEILKAFTEAIPEAFPQTQ